MFAQRLRRVALVTLLAALSLANTTSGYAEDHDDELGDISDHDNLPLEQLRNFSDIFARIKTDYVEEVGDKALLENAIRGMLSGLDPHSTYLDPEEYKELKIGTSGQFGGLGIQVGVQDGYVKVIAPIDDTPAYHAGLKAGDLIIQLGEKSVKDMSLNDAVKMMRGRPGTYIELSVVREGHEDPLQFRLKRAVINVKSVKSYLLEPDFAYVRISTFQSKTARHLKQGINRLIEKNQRPLKGLIVDLRNNPGGVLNAAADVSDAFIDEGRLVYTQGRIDESYFEFNAKKGDLIEGAPMVVLINGGSASASEIVAGALQDHKRAVIMGEKSFGKGSVQTIQELRNGGAVKFTTARYFTPNGRSIQALGIEPDIELKDMQLSESKKNKVQVKEANLSGHISNPKGNSRTSEKRPRQSTEDESIRRLHGDYKVHEALNLLKGMNILKTKQTTMRIGGAK